MTSNPVVSNIVKNYKYVENAFLPKTVLVPLFQEHNVDCVSLVKIGDLVKEGQIIASSENSDKKVYIHSPIPGKVADIIPCKCANGKQKYAVKIELAGSFSYIGKKHTEKQLDSLKSDEIVESLIDKGVINTFKISKVENLGVQIKNLKKDACLIVRLFDEDPYRITDSLITKFFVNEIIKGAQAIAKGFNAKGIVFAIDQKLASKENINITNIQNARILEMNLRRYPCGTPRELVSGFNRRVRTSCNFSVFKSDVFIDASTAYEAYKAIYLDTPSIERYVHISGNCINTSCLLNVKIGTNTNDLVNTLGGFIKAPKNIIVNGNMAGNSVNTINFPIGKDTKSISFISKRKFTDNHIHSCINCGNCRFACPVKIAPDVLYNNAIHFKALEEPFLSSVLICTDCGLCNSVCPSRLPLSQTIDVLKTQIKKDENKNE